MSRPRIVKETKRTPDERKPPAPEMIHPHDWLSRESLETYRITADSTLGFDVYLSELAEKRIRNHSLKGAKDGIEVMGFLLGEVCTWKGDPYVFVRDVGTTRLKSSASKVKFDPDAFPALFRELDSAGFDYILVGWYHSHPGHTCFLSRTDLKTQRNYFRESYHVAVVIDPLNEEIKAFKLSGAGYVEVSFGVVVGRIPNGTDAPPARKRRLKRTSELGQ